MKKLLFPIVIISLIMTSCVSSKKYVTLESKYQNIKGSLQKTTLEKEALEARFAKIESRIDNYNNKINSLRDENVTLERSSLKFTKNNLTVLSKKQKEDLAKVLAKVDARKLSQAKTLRDSLNLALDFNFKNSMNSAGLYDEKDIDVNVENTVVMISISDKLLFKSGSTKVNEKAHALLQKLADVINSEPSMDVMIEGHTDSRTIKKSNVKDNWDLSVLRATSIVRILEKEYYIKSNRLIASGRGSSMPLVPNNSKANRAKNRRTKIIILPNLDKFFALMANKE